MKCVIVIPARYESARYPGKPLVLLNGRTLIQRVYELATKVKNVADVYVATDDDKIMDHVKGFGGKCLMTPASCPTGTDRVAAAAEMLSPDIDAFINWQGDSPLTPPSYPTKLIERLEKSRTAELVTPVIRCDGQLFDALKNDRNNNRVGATTVVFDKYNRAGYFSKEIIPWRDKLTSDTKNLPIFYHVGMYGYRRDVLLQYPTWEVGPLEKTEQLEQLRFIENGRVVEVVELEGKGHWEVNNPEDVPIVEKLLKEHGID